MKREHRIRSLLERIRSASLEAHELLGALDLVRIVDSLIHIYPEGE